MFITINNISMYTNVQKHGVIRIRSNTNIAKLKRKYIILNIANYTIIKHVMLTIPRVQITKAFIQHSCSYYSEESWHVLLQTKELMNRLNLVLK